MNTVYLVLRYTDGELCDAKMVHSQKDADTEALYWEVSHDRNSAQIATLPVLTTTELIAD